MKSARNFALVLVTAPDLRTARALARSALKARLIACANLVPGLESHYWWREKMERSAEVLLICKTCRSRLSQLEKLILKEHPYDTPEFLTLPLGQGTTRYLEWLDDNVR